MRYPLVYGGLAGIIAIVLIILSMTLDLPSHAHSMWFGYLLMIAALSLIFVGVKRYRDVEKGGTIRFGEALVLGLGIAFVASIIYVGGFKIYYATPTGHELFDMIVVMEPRYAGTLFRWGWGFMEILPVDLVIALISAALLRNPRVLPARGAAA